VLTHLNPWLVALHFLLSMAILFVTFWLWWRVRESQPALVTSVPARVLAWLATSVALAVLAFGTVVTGAGPHAGDTNDSGKVRRIGFKISSVAQLHADAVMVLIGLSVGLLVLLIAVGASRSAIRAARLLLAIEGLQGAIGYTQYFLHVPPALVALHMLGASLLWLATLNVLAHLEPRAAGRT
jgi:cytochrome c oxidase assembly protein subunit 15